MKTTVTRNVPREETKIAGNRSSKTSHFWIHLTLGVIAAALCLVLQAAAADDDIDAKVREKEKLIEVLSTDYKFYQMILDDPDIWVIPGLTFPVPIPKSFVIDGLSANYRRPFVTGQKPWERYSEKELSSMVMTLWEFTKAFKAELKQHMTEIELMIKGLRTEIVALKKPKEITATAPTDIMPLT